MESNVFNKVEPEIRLRLVQSVIDRINEYGDEYVFKLMSLNSTYMVTKTKEVTGPRNMEDLKLPSNIKICKTVLPS